MDLQPNELETTTLAEQSYEILRRAIASGELRPGDRLTERGLAKLLNVSPTPIRDALRRLEREQAVERIGPRKLVVAGTSASIEQRIELRAAMRGLVARYAARNATDQQIQQLEAILDDSDDVWRLIVSRKAEGLPIDSQLQLAAEMAKRNNQLVNACAGDTQLIRLLDQTELFTEDELGRYRLEYLSKTQLPDNRYWEDDRAVLKAIKARDEAEAERITVAHVRKTFTALFTTLGVD